MSARILIAEDERLLADELQDRLTHLGFTVVGIAATADDAVARARQAAPDLVLMDIHLKGERDGISAAIAIASLDVPVIFLTAHSDAATVERAKAAAPVGYLIKPIRERELHITVMMALHKYALERQLRDSEERFVAMLASIGDGVVATDRVQRITFMNPMAEGLTGWASASALGRPIDEVFQVVDAGSRRRMPCPVAGALASDGVVTLGDNALLITRGGLEIPVDDSAAPIRNARGTVSGAVLVFRDISVRKAAAVALEKAEDRMRQGQKLEALGRLAGGVAHDINNMMTVVSGCAEMLLDGLSPEDPRRELAEQIKVAGDRSADITRQLLAFSRRQILKAGVVDLNAIVGDLGPMLNRLIREDVHMRVVAAPVACGVRVDRIQIEQVIINLAVNARDAMPEGGTLTVETGVVELDTTCTFRAPEIAPGPYALLAISDTGVGMDPDTRRQIFEPFFTTKEIGRGTGLGLATVYGIVKQSGGFIYVYSEPGHGTTFKVYLPLVSEPLAAAALVPVAPQAAGQGEHVLLVEDDESVRRIARLLLERSGYSVTAAADGHEALGLVAQGLRPALLLTDAVMPGMNGRTLAERMAKEIPGLKVLFMSGYTHDGALRQGIFTEDVAFVQKPFTAEQLASSVRRVLDQPGADSGVREAGLPSSGG